MRAEKCHAAFRYSLSSANGKDAGISDVGQHGKSWIGFPLPFQSKNYVFLVVPTCGATGALGYNRRWTIGR